MSIALVANDEAGSTTAMDPLVNTSMGGLTFATEIIRCALTKAQRAR